MPYAWAIWEGWRGETDLIAHVARLATRAASDGAGQDPTALIEVYVGEDVEVFSSPKEFRDAVTREGLRRFHRIRMQAATPNLKVCVSMIRRRRGDSGWLREGVLLEVRSDEDEFTSTVVEVRDRLFAAINRGKHGQLNEKGDASSGRSPEDVVHERTNQLSHQRKLTYLSVPLLIVAPLVLTITGDAPLTSASASDFAAPLLGGVLGLVPSLAHRWLFPNVEVKDVGRARQMTGAAAKLAGPVIGATLGIAGRVFLG